MKYILLSLVFLPVLGFSQSYDSLETAYKKNSEIKLTEFLDNWNETIKSNEDSVSSGSHLKKEIFKIYDEFYNPFNLMRIGNGEWGDSLYFNVKYVIIQNRIDFLVLNNDSIGDFNFSIADSLILSKDSIMDFRPNVIFPNAKTLYLTKDYGKTLTEFLKDKHHPLGFRGIMNPARAKGSSLDKQRFLNNYFLIIYGHWGGYWHLETHPYVFRIIFNKTMDTARVDFRLVYQGGDAILKKIDNKWEFVKGELTWIE
jgi:hypothetical protein